MLVYAAVLHWESLLVVEREGGDISGDEGDGAQMAGRTILDRNDVRKWAEEVHQRLTKRA